MGAGDSGLVNLGDWEETGLEKDDEDFEVGFLRRGKRERGEIRVSMFLEHKRKKVVWFFFTDEAFFLDNVIILFPKGHFRFCLMALLLFSYFRKIIPILNQHKKKI